MPPYTAAEIADYLILDDFFPDGAAVGSDPTDDYVTITLDNGQVFTATVKENTP